MVFLVLIHGGPAAATMPPKPLLKSLQYAVTTSFGSICYGSLFTAAIRTLRWEVCTFTSSCNTTSCLISFFIFLSIFYPYFLSFTKLQIRGIRSKIGSNECLLCCIDFLFHIVETLVRFFNKYAYVQVSDLSVQWFSRCDYVVVKSLHISSVFFLFLSPRCTDNLFLTVVSYEVNFISQSTCMLGYRCI